MIVIRHDKHKDLWIWPGSGYSAKLVTAAMKRRPIGRRRWVQQWHAWWVCRSIERSARSSLSRIAPGDVLNDGQHDDLFSCLREEWFKRLTSLQQEAVHEMLSEPRPWSLIAVEIGSTPGEVGRMIEDAWLQLEKVRLLKEKS